MKCCVRWETKDEFSLLALDEAVIGDSNKRFERVTYWSGWCQDCGGSMLSYTVYESIRGGQ